MEKVDEKPYLRISKSKSEPKFPFLVLNKWVHTFFAVFEFVTVDGYSVTSINGYSTYLSADNVIQRITPI